MKIFIGLTEVSGYYSRLKKGFDELGIQAVHVPLLAHRFNYSEAIPSHLFVRWARYAVSQRVSLQNPSGFQAALWLALVVLTRLLLFAWAIFKFDTFILGGGSSFFSFRELPLLRLLGKKIIYTFHGTDARPAYLDGFFTPDQIGMKWPPSTGANNPSKDEALQRQLLAKAHLIETRRRKAAVRAVERHAHAVICVPSFAQFLTRDFVNFLIVGIPLESDIAPQTGARSGGGSVRILHAPSQPEGKGTGGIRHAIDNLKKNGLDIDYVEITGRPHDEVLAEIARCDFVIDQLYSDTPMAGFAAEAAFLAKPAIVGGYYSRLIRQHMREGFIPPTYFCAPDAIGQAVEKLVGDIEFRTTLGMQAARFVKEQWRARNVAERYLQVIGGNTPEEWKSSPQHSHYVHGVGLSEDRIKGNLKSLIALYGTFSLQFSDNPKLEKLLVDLANQEPVRNAG